ncbi:Sulredoxin [uncultured archaeon]|nr:Sulredoxin [uncultured archaeon]
MDFVRIGMMSDIPKGGMKGFVIDGKKILVAEVDGKYYAMDSVCSHMKGPLEKGTLAGKDIQCPWHGSIFDVTTAKVVGGPAMRDLVSYEVKSENGEVFVKL